MSIHDIENIKRRQLFKLLRDKREEGLNVFDAQDLVKTSSFYRRIGDFKDMGHRFRISEKKLTDPSTGKLRTYQHYHLLNDEPDTEYKLSREANRIRNKRYRKLKGEIRAFEKLSANGQADTCPVCMSETTRRESKEENQHDQV